MHHIYIIYSEQFGSNVYKVGYTEDLENRIKDSCYTTCFYKPCRYQKVWQYDTTVVVKNGELVEKQLHQWLAKAIKNLCDGSNRCTEMYEVELDQLVIKIDQFLTQSIGSLISHFIRINDINQYIADEIIYQRGEYLGHTIKAKQICYDCNRPMQQCYEIRYNNISYYFGVTCYNKLRELYYIPMIDDKIEKCITEHLSVNFRFKYNELDCRIDDNNSILYNAFIKMGNKKESFFQCKCSDEYYLYRLSKKFQDTFRIDKRDFEKEYKFSEPRLKIFYQKLVNMNIFNITGTHISLCEQDEQIAYIEEEFSKYKLVADDIKNNSSKNNYSKSQTAIDRCFRYNRSILSGVAGSGKTTGIFGFVHEETTLIPSKLAYFFDTPKQILILAFTGKAVSALRTKHEEIMTAYYSIAEDGTNRDKFSYLTNMQCTFQTIDSYLLDSIKSKKRINYDWVIIDEFSMVKLSHLYQVVQLCTASNIMLLGDENQLPPIGSPSIVNKMIDQCTVNTYEKSKFIFGRMTECKRTECSLLLNIYNGIINRKLNSISSIKSYIGKFKTTDGSVNFITLDNLKTYDPDTKIITSENSQVRNLYDKLTDTFINKTYMVTENLYVEKYQIYKIVNLLKKLSTKKSVYRCSLGKLQSEVEIEYPEYQEDNIYNLTDLNKELYKINTNYINSIINHCVACSRIDSKRCMLFYNGQDLIFGQDDQIKFTLDNDTIRLLKDIITVCTKKELQTAQSNIITIHKAQGSGYNHIIIDARNPNLSFQMLYTAVTRARNKITFIVSKDIMENETDTLDITRKLIRLASIEHCNVLAKLSSDDISGIQKTISNCKIGWFLTKITDKFDQKEKELFSKLFRVIM